MKAALERPFNHVQQPRRTGPIPHTGEVDDDGHILVPATSVTPDVFVHAEHLDAIETGVIADQAPASFVQDGGVGGVPRHPERLRYATHRQVCHHESFERPGQSCLGELAPWRCRGVDVLAPHVPAASAAVATQPDLQNRRAPSQRSMGQFPHRAVAHAPFATAPSAPAVIGDDAAGQHCLVRKQTLTDCL